MTTLQSCVRKIRPFPCADRFNAEIFRLSREFPCPTERALSPDPVPVLDLACLNRPNAFNSFTIAQIILSKKSGLDANPIMFCGTTLRIYFRC
jgi:hypothetical protein